MKREKKLNGGRGAILCNKCRVIVKEGFASDPYLNPLKFPNPITTEDWESDEPLYCEDCLKNKDDANGRRS